MIDNWKVLDRIERAEQETPFCYCGEPMSPVAKPDGIWIECVSRLNPDESRLGRLRSVLTAGGHTSRQIVELDQAA